METEAQQMVRFIGRLGVVIQDKISMHPIFMFTEAVSLVTWVGAKPYQLDTTYTRLGKTTHNSVGGPKPTHNSRWEGSRWQ